jgi:hypothetical protein
VRLFSSLARGERNPFADADILIVLEASDLAYRERLPRYKPSGAPVPMNLTVCTRGELAANNRRQRALQESILLYSRPSP